MEMPKTEKEKLTALGVGEFLPVLKKQTTYSAIDEIKTDDQFLPEGKRRKYSIRTDRATKFPYVWRLENY